MFNKEELKKLGEQICKGLVVTGRCSVCDECGEYYCHAPQAPDDLCEDCIKKEDKRYRLQKGEVAYTTGAFIRWTGTWWKVTSFEDDTYYDGKLVEEVETSPYIEIEEE